MSTVLGHYYSTKYDCRCFCCGITMHNFISHLGYPISSLNPLFEDNKGAHPLVKHIDLPLCYFHEKHKSSEFKVSKCSTHLLLADGLNKVLSGPTLKHHFNIYTGRHILRPKTSYHYRELTKICPLF